jgi:hypothetical protein
MSTRECPFCGKSVYARLTQCPYCREPLPVVVRVRTNINDGGREIRRGLLFVLLAAVIGYFAGGYSALPLPIPVLPIVGKYLSPLLALSGLGLTVHGYILNFKSHSSS